LAILKDNSKGGRSRRSIKRKGAYTGEEGMHKERRKGVSYISRVVTRKGGGPKRNYEGKRKKWNSLRGKAEKKKSQKKEETEGAGCASMAKALPFMKKGCTTGEGKERESEHVPG